MKEYLFFQNHKKFLPKDKSLGPAQPADGQGQPSDQMGKTGVDFRQIFYQQKQ